MFNSTYYPTPSAIADEMLRPYREKIKAGAMILDPSAGRGNLLDACRYAGTRAENLFAVEIEPDLAAILRDKKYRLIGDDFLQYASHYHFDLIVMNPPFVNGDEHLLKAWEILHEGDIVCLLNAETVRNPHTVRRQLLARIIQENGSVEYLGQVFKSAERPTGVDVALIRLKKTADRPLFAFTDSGERRRQPTFSGDQTIDFENEIARADLIAALVDTYDQIGPAYEQFIAARNRLEFYVKALIGNHRLSFDAGRARYAGGNDARQQDLSEFNGYLDAVKFAGWQTVFEKTKMRNVLTAKMRDAFNAFQQQAGSMEFTQRNIYSLFGMLLDNRDANLQACVVDVFDKMTSYDAKNKIHVEGWKTNSRYRVNQRVIMPYFIQFETWGDRNGRGKFDVYYQNTEHLRDIDRVMCLLSGKSLDPGPDRDQRRVVTIEDALRARFSALGYIDRGDEFDNTADSEFFTIKFWKKGTMHLIFKDLFLWQEFNRRAAAGKNWLGDAE